MSTSTPSIASVPATQIECSALIPIQKKTFTFHLRRLTMLCKRLIRSCISELLNANEMYTRRYCNVWIVIGTVDDILFKSKCKSTQSQAPQTIIIGNETINENEIIIANIILPMIVRKLCP